MRASFTSWLVVVLAVGVAPTSIAATVTIVPSTLTPAIGETFTLTVTGDVGNTIAATMGLSFDDTKVAFVSGVPTGTWNDFIKNSPVTQNPTVFDIETPTPTAASPGIYSSAILTFQALAGGAANIVINDDGGNASGWFDAVTADYIPVTYTQANVNVSAAPAPVIVVTDSVVPADDLMVPFGQVMEGVTSAPQTITVTNTGDADLVIGLVTGLAPPFALAGPENCSGATLQPDEACAITVDFTPDSSGEAAGTLQIPSSLPTVTVSVSGTGTPIPVGNAVVTDSVAPFADNQIPFGSVTVNTQAVQTVTVTNTGNASLTLGQVAMANALLAPFSIGTDSCSGQIIVAGGTCSFQVLFEPTAAGDANDTLDVPSDDPDQPTATVSVSGTGAPVPVGDISVTDSVNPAGDLAVGYGNVALGSSVNQTITVANTGTGSLLIGAVGSPNALAPPFSVVSNSCSGQALAPAATCTVVVAFAPGAEQPYSDSVNIPSDDPDEASVTVAVSGAGVPAPPGGGGSSAIDLATVVALGLLGVAGRRRVSAHAA